MHAGFESLQTMGGIISNNSIVEIFQILKNTTDGFRQTPGTALKNDKSGEIVYVPPQSGDAIITHMRELERFINTPLPNNVDPIIAMALIHHQFESIHPFPDGNGRIGRILNVLYLCKTELLEIPILYISRYITRHKDDYYRLLQSTRDTGEWEPWLLYMIKAVEETALETTELIRGIKKLMADYKGQLRSNHKKIYTQEFLNNLFRHPYTRIEYLMDETGVSRQTASRHLNEITDAGLLTKLQIGNANYFVNDPLIDLLYRRPHGVSV